MIDTESICADITVELATISTDEERISELTSSELALVAGSGFRNDPHGIF